MLKSTKRLIISTEAVNCYGFRILTSGIDLKQYKNNPILLYMHIRPVGNSKDQILPLGFISDLQVDGTVLSGIPNFDNSDSFAVSIYNKVENGTLKMCSAGLKALEFSDDRALMIDGQTQPTITKSILIEVSIADIGGNPEALAVALYNKDGQIITLSTNAVKETLKEAQKNGHDGSKLLAHTPEMMAIINNAIEAGKLSTDEGKSLLTMPGDEGTVKSIREVIKKSPIKSERLQGKYHPMLIKQAALSWDELGRQGGGVNTLREHAPEIYKAKFFEKHDRMPAEQAGKPL